MTENLSQLYEQDYILWLEKNITFIKDGKFNYVDLENLIEELESLGKSEKRTILSLIRQILIHLLLYQYWTKEREWNGHHWEAEIINFRNQLNRELNSKTLYNYAISELNSLYQDAVDFTTKKSKLTCFPDQCPYTFDQIIDKNWLPVTMNNEQLSMNNYQ